MSETKPGLGQINVVAKDFDATVEFYNRLGLEIPDDPPPDGGMRHAQITLSNGLLLEFDDQKLAGIYNAAWRHSESGSRVSIGFSLPSRESVDQKFSELVDSGYEGKQPPYDTFWGARYAVVADPDGNDVGLLSPIEEKRRYWPPKNSPSL